MSNLVRFEHHLKTARIAHQSAAPAPEPEPEPAAEVDVAAIEKKAYERGRNEAQKEFKEKIEAARVLQGDLLSRLQEAEQALAETVEAALPELVIEGVRRVIPQWSPEAEDIQGVIQGMLSGLEGESGPLEIRLNERDKAHLEELGGSLSRDFSATTLIADPGLRSGECVVSGRFGMVDGRFESKLNGLRKDLS